MYMMSSVLFIGAIVVLEALPVHLVVTSGYRNHVLSSVEWFVVAMSFAAVLLLSLLVFMVPMRVGLRRLEKMETL
jgi:hypothetical protein